MTAARASRITDALLGIAAMAAILLALTRLDAAGEGVERRAFDVAGTPATAHLPEGPALGPVLVIAHGFAGSQQLMQSFALAAARNGYASVTYDLAGHGRNPAPLGGSITDPEGATRRLVDQLGRVVEVARRLGDGRVAVLGHSMASDIVVRFAQQTPGIGATIAVSMFAPTVTETTPPNLLVIVGALETALAAEALRAVGLAAAPGAAQMRVTYGDPAAGTARRAAASPWTEHVSVLFAQASLAETVGWLDLAFGIPRAGPPRTDMRGPWIVLLLAGVVALMRPLARLLPVVSSPPAGAGLGWRALWPVIVVPAVATPLVLRVLPTKFLPVLVGDYLAMHFLAFGLIAAACLAACGRGPIRPAPPPALSRRALVLATLGAVAFGLVGLAWPIDRLLTSFALSPGRLTLFLALLAGTAAHFLAAEWATRGPGSARGGYAAMQAGFLASLIAAVALDFERLFFLLIIVPVIVIFFAIYGHASAVLQRRTGHPFVGGIATAIAFAWAIAATFPLVEG